MCLEERKVAKTMPAIILICMGILLGILSDAFKKVPHSKSILGEIVSLEQKRWRNEGKKTYAAYVEFSVKDVIYVVKTKYKSSTFRIGDKMRIVYNEQNPNQAIIRPKREVYFTMFGFFIAGVIVGFNCL